MNHLGLFEGIGGFSLAARWAGWHTVAWCEINPFGQQVLKYHFPNAKGHDDITKTDFTVYRGTVDIITGGFPCQPYSLAGKRLGKEDERHLWPEMLRAIREVQPRWVVGENVAGLVNWSGGLVFEEVQAELEAEGYEVLAFVLPAAGVGAPHRRDRVWFVAYSDDARTSAGLGQVQGEDGKVPERHNNAQLGDAGCDGVVPDTTSQRLQRCIKTKDSNIFVDRIFGNWQQWNNLRRKTSYPCVKWVVADSNNSIWGKRLNQWSECHQKNGGKIRNQFTTTCESGFITNAKENGRFAKPFGWQDFPTESPICRGNDGLSKRLDGITFSKWRSESLKAYGNAIVPQVALQIFNSINQFENELAKFQG